MTDNNEYKGLGGWLILLGLGVVVGPARISLEVLPMFYGIFTDGTFEVLTTPGTEYYHAMWGPLLVFEFVFNSLMILASLYAIYLFFSKHYLFPRVYIVIIIVSLVFIPFDAWLASFVLPDEPMFDPDTTQEFLRSVIATVIWIPYLINSKRANATFVEHKPNAQEHEQSTEASE